MNPLVKPLEAVAPLLAKQVKIATGIWLAFLLLALLGPVEQQTIFFVGAFTALLFLSLMSVAHIACKTALEVAREEIRAGTI